MPNQYSEWNPIKRFWMKVEKTETCWLWRGARIGRGYGMFELNYKSIYAHRHSWTLANGEIPPGICVLHRCDNPSCVNPDHFFLGTNAENSKDCVNKKRQWRKLTPEQVIEIRQLAKRETRQSIADKMGVFHSTINAIVNGKTWKHLQG